MNKLILIGIFVTLLNLNFVLGANLATCDTLSTDGETYNLTNDVDANQTCMSITGNNVTLDCNGFNINYSITGSASDYGIYNVGNDTIIRNCNITQANHTSGTTYRHGIYFLNNYGGQILDTIIEVIVPGHDGYGIYLFGSDDNNLSGIRSYSSESYGIRLNDAHNNTFYYGNYSSDGHVAFRMDLSDDNYLRYNRFTSTDENALLVGTSDDNTFRNNNGTTVDENAVTIDSSFDNYFNSNNFYSTNKDGIHLESSDTNRFIINSAWGYGDDSFAIWLYDSHNNTLISNTGTANGTQTHRSSGIYLLESHENYLFYNQAYNDNSYSLRLNFSDRNILRENTAATNSYYSLFIHDSHYNNITGNTGTALDSHGFAVGCRLNFASNNSFTNNICGSVIEHGLLVSSSPNNTIANNTMYTTSERGVLFDDAWYNVVRDNNVSSGVRYSYSFENASYNTIESNIGSSTTNFTYYFDALSDYNVVSNNDDPILLTGNTNYFYSLTDALIHNSTNVTAGSLDITTNDGNINVTTPAGELYYLIDNYYLSRTDEFLSDPISMTGTSLTKTVTSLLVENVTIPGRFTLSTWTADSQLRAITITRAGGETTEYTSGWSIDDGIISFDLERIPLGASTVTFSFTNCSQWENITYPIIMLLLAVGILIMVIYFLKGDLEFRDGNAKNWEALTLRNVLIAFLIILLSIAFLSVIGDTLAARCALQ